jgi:hypothetical protein
MRMAAIYDIHGNLPALEAVLKEIRLSAVDRILVMCCPARCRVRPWLVY